MINRMKQWMQTNERRRELRARTAFNAGMHRIDTGGKKLNSLYETYRHRAVEEERNGNHEAALRFASEAEKLKGQQKATGDMRDTIVTTQALRESVSALTGIVKASSALAGGASLQKLSNSFCDAQMDMELMRDELDLALEQTNDLVSEITDTSDPVFDREAGEAALAKLVKSEESARKKQLLQETKKKLDALQKDRVKE